MKTTTRIATATLGLAAAAGIALGAAGTAHAGTLPVTRPGEPTVAMTITNHTDKPEYLQGANADGGQWVNAPQHILYPGATETLTATAPYTNHLDVNAIYRIGLFGPTANYQLTNHPHNVNTDMSTIWGPHAQNYWLNSHIDTHYPQVNVGFDQW